MDRPSDVGTRCSTAGFYWTRQSDVQGDTESGQLIIQWEFSLAATLIIVARGLLATILEQIQLSVVVAKDAQETKQRSRG